MLDVIEHADDDAELVSSTVDTLLAADGVVLVSVPAYDALYSSHDRELRHRRRYSPARCRELIEQARLSIVSSGGLFASLVPLRAAQVLHERIRPRARSRTVSTWGAGPRVTRVVTRALVLDGEASLRLSERGIALPGLSYWALCRPIAR